MHIALDEITGWFVAALAFGIAGYLLATARRRLGHYVIAVILLAIAFLQFIALTSVTIRQQLHIVSRL